MPLKILVKYPSRERPERFFDGMDSIYNHAYDVNNLSVLISADENDSSMNNKEVQERIGKYNNATVIYGTSKSKIDAVNRDLEKEGSWNDWDILVNMSDDMRMNIFGWDEMVRTDFNYKFHDLDGLMHYLDVDTKGMLATMYIAGRKFYERFGYIYNPVYKSLFADNEIEECAKLLNKWHYTGYSIYTHLNPAYGHLPRDPLFNTQQALWNEDEKTYNERKARNFDLKISE